MPTKGDSNEHQTHEYKRQKPRRLFSFDSIKSSGSTRQSSSDHEPPQIGRPLNPFDLSNVEEKAEEDEKEHVIYAPRAKRSSTEPTPESTPMSQLEFDQRTGKPGRSRLEPVRPIAIAPVALRSFTLDSAPSTPSPTRARWENLRQHVLPAPHRPATPPQRPPSAQSSVNSHIPPRSNTPKPSRLAKLGFRHVVEQARDVIGDSRKLGEEIKRACAIARYTEPQKPSKDGSTTTLTSTVALGSSAIASGKKNDYLRRPQSVSATSLPSGSGAPSLRFLYQILVYHSAESNNPNAIHLPYETYVLSTLLCPFLTPTKYPYMRVEEEQSTAVDTFELLTKSWAPIDEAATVARSIWCIRAASSLFPSSTRTRILGTFWRILVPVDRNKILLTTHGYYTISSGLLLLLAALYRTSPSATPANSPYPRSPSFKTSNGLSLPSANFTHPPHPDINLVQDLIPHFLSGSLGEVDDDQIEEVYGVEFGTSDRRNPSNIRRVLFMESLMVTIENTPGTGEWLLCNAVERYWPIPAFDSWSTLQAAIACRKINSFCRHTPALLRPFIARYSSPSSTSTIPSKFASSPSLASSTTLDTSNQLIGNPAIASEIVTILKTRAIPEAEALDNETELDAKVVTETRKLVARTVLELICLNIDVGASIHSSNSGTDVFGAGPSPSFGSGSGNEIQTIVKWARDTLCRWYQASDLPWRTALEQALSQVISTDWTTAICISSALLRQLPDIIKKPIFAFLIPVINDQFVDRPPPYPSPRISDFLTSISRSLPQIFFKPLFACGASDQDIIVANHLCTVQVHTKYVKDYWVRDVDMISFALLGSAKDLKSSDSPEIWSNARLGQLVLLVQLIGQIQRLRHQKEACQTQNDGSFNEYLRFAVALEARVWSMIELKERTQQMAPSLRMLLCALFRELRLLTRSLKPAPWLERLLGWFDQYIEDEHIGDLEQEVTGSAQRIQDLYLTAQAGVQERHKRHTSVLAAGLPKGAILVDPSDDEKRLELATTLMEHKKLIESLNKNKGYMSKAMKAFVSISSLLSAKHCAELGPLLWQHCLLDDVDSSLTASVCFLIMHCTEKSPIEVRAAIEVDLQSSDDMYRLEAVRKISILINWRFQIISQNFVADRTHRPFKLARPPLSFMATDIGSSLYIHFEDPKETKDKDDVPLELKKRLAELGWTEDDATTVDPRLEWIKTPFSILPINQWDRQEVGTADIAVGGSPSPHGSPQPSPRKLRIQRENLEQIPQAEDLPNLLRRNSSSGGPMNSVKRRAVFVPPLTLVFPRLCTLVFDSNFAVASAARTTILDLMRNDPALLTRPMLDLLAGDTKDIQLAISTFTALLHVRRMLPPPVAHNIFNNLAGFLKLLARHENTPNSLEDFAMVLPIMSSLATQVSGLSIREIRRAKIEHFVIPTGTLWFSSAAPKGPMFPRSLGASNNPFEPVPSRLVSITMIRVAQNMFFLSMLKKNYQDVTIVRKNMSTLTLPSLDDDGFSKELELQDFMPRKVLKDTRPSIRNGNLEILSLMVARSSILLIAQIFRSMPRHLSDRHELAVLIDGLNRSLVAHGDDINIVSHVLIALMVASTRFRRLFTSGSGYALFMPALVKVYTETPSHPGIRKAIEYALNRFYALHKDSFLYQTVSTIAQLSSLPHIDSAWFSKAVYDLFASLRKGVSPSDACIGGIYHATRAEEREALILHTADEKPQTFLAAIKRVESETGRIMSLQLPDEYESHQLDMPDLVRLFLTIIAHDLSISRAQHFLRLLRFLTPHLYNSSSKTKTVLADGIDALGQIFTKVFSKPKYSENMLKSISRDEDAAFLPSGPGLENSSKERSRSPSDTKELRLDYLRLVVAFGSAGGQVSLTVARHAFDIVKSLLKDWGDTNLDSLSAFLDDFMKMLLNREEHGSPKAIVAFLQELSPLLHSHMVSIDFTGVFESVLKLAEMPMYATDSSFCQVVVEEICTAGLAACDLAVSENQLMTLPYRPILISLLAESVFLKSTDIIAELEKRQPTYQYLCGVILPLTLSMKTEAQVIGNASLTEHHRLALSAAWVRILSYAMTACQKSRRDEDGTRQLRSLASSFTRSKSTGRGRQDDAFWRSHLPIFMSALQIIKVVVIRGGANISYLPRLGIWERLAAFFKTMLAEGSAEFALKTDSSSATSTPTGSPRSSRQFDLSNSASRLFVSTSSDLSRPGSPFSQTERMPTYYRPRIIDYSLWSVLEFACAYRSPLRMQLKILTMEKVVALDQALQHQAWLSGGLSAISPSPSSRRISTSIFSKSRTRVSGLLAPSPESSPRMMPTSSSLMASPSLLEIPGRVDIPSRRPGYQASPISANDGGGASGLPKIIHLGPVSPSAITPAVSPLIGGLKGGRAPGADADSEGTVAKATRIKSLKLIQDTYRRIRGVQAYMGYELLLPMPGTSLNTAFSKDKDEDAGLETWTSSQALNAIMSETKDLLEEFEESFAIDEESVLVDMDQTMASDFANSNS